MHSHQGLQERELLAARPSALIISDQRDRHGQQDVVAMLADSSFRSCARATEEARERDRSSLEESILTVTAQDREDPAKWPRKMAS